MRSLDNHKKKKIVIVVIVIVIGHNYWPALPSGGEIVNYNRLPIRLLAKEGGGGRKEGRKEGRERLRNER